jgi:catechol 2,3-dioxygenase-like lactoylglutathione lyase family enzyme
MKINEVEIFTDNFEETTAFYSKILGFELIHSDQQTLTYKTGQTKLVFKRSFNLKPEYHFAFNIPCNKFDEALSWITEKTELIKISGDNVIADFKNWNAKSFYFYDNNGNILEFIARFDLNNRSVKSFDASSVESVSEIGLVTDDPHTYAEDLAMGYNLPHFSKGGESDVFVPLGDDHGLLIVVGVSKHWYPTDTFVKKSPVGVKFMSSNKEVEIKLNNI